MDHGNRTPEVQCPVAASVTSEARMDAAVPAATQAPDLHALSSASCTGPASGACVNVDTSMIQPQEFLQPMWP